MSRIDQETAQLGNLLHGKLVGEIAGVFYDVHREMGFGFAEPVYARSMVLGLADAGLRVEREVPCPVFFRGRQVGLYKADLVVEGNVLVELKAGLQLPVAAQTQVLNYLAATRLEVGLLLHFGERPRFKRLIFSNARKRNASSS